jgi:hypothetical protein
LSKYGTAVAVGHFGQPQGRKQLEQRRRHVQLGTRPEVKQWQERGWDIDYERALAAERLACTTMARGKKTGDPATTSATSVADDTERRSRLSTSPTLADPTPPISPPEAAGTGATSTGFGGRTLAEDSEAAITGLVPHPHGPHHAACGCRERCHSL